jgi:hypothetical protein
MKRAFRTFIILSLLKGVTLFIIIRISNIFPGFPIALRFLIFFVLISLFDWKTFNLLSKILKNMIWIKLASFSLGTSLFVPMIAAYLFRINNYIFNVVVDENAKMTFSALITFFIIVLFFLSLTTTIWIKVKKLPPTSMQNLQ